MTNRATKQDERWPAAAICLLLAAITFAVFGQTLTHEFIDFDDRTYVYENPMVAGGLSLKGVAWAFTHVQNANWHPLTWLSHMLDCQLYGLHPGGHHLTNVLLHTATVIALFLVLRQMTGALWRSAFVAAVFAIHPLRVESVAWVAERKDVLSGLFFMLTIGAYVRYARHPWSPLRYGLVVLLFAMGLMCKPMLVTLPLVLLLLDYWPLQRAEPTEKLVLEKLPLLALSAASCLLTLLVQKEAMSTTASISVPLRFANALTTCMVYLGQMVWPSGLAVFYPFPHNGLPPGEVALAGALLAVFSVAAWAARRKQPWLLMGWVWYLVMLLPVVGIIQVGRQAHADRYTYLPQIGIYVAVTWLVAEWRVNRAAMGSLMAGVVAVLMFCAWKQTGYWKDRETLWTHTLACTTGNDTAHNNLGYVLFQKGRVDEAIDHFRQTLQVDPNYKDAHYNLANALLQKGNVDEAIVQYREALQLKPDHAQALINLGNALRQTGQADEAIIQYQKALQADPDNVAAGNNLGIVLFQKGRTDEALTQFQKVLQINPNNADARVTLGSALLQIGKTDEAINEYQRALQIKPANPEVQNDLAWLLATCPEASLRNGNKAIELAQQANNITGRKNPIILHTLAAAFAEAGKFDDAKLTVQRAVELASAAGRQNLVEQLNKELKRYEAGRPLHE
jgi:protein O-mannosyl-transferase